MKKICLFFVLIAMVVLILPENGRATTIMTNPNPLLFADDDGAELFIPNSSVFSVEYFDLAGSIGYFSAFGFYFSSDPSTLIPIFGAADQGISGDRKSTRLNSSHGYIS